uniref:Uncharacterized protein n=1 Tax=Nothoprocta perdicaria TaxID=30464 RepID=A0A8C7EH40_NOTPE
MKLLTHNLLTSHVRGLRPGGGFPLRIQVPTGTGNGNREPGTGPEGGGAARCPAKTRPLPAEKPAPCRNPLRCGRSPAHLRRDPVGSGSPSPLPRATPP